MAEVRMKDGVLPELETWDRDFRESVGEALVIRGVEVTVDGTLVVVDGQPAFLKVGNDKVFRLATLEHKVQWDQKLSREQTSTPVEREAFRRLADPPGPAEKRSARVWITGPLNRPDRQGELPTITVRTFDRSAP